MYTKLGNILYRELLRNIEPFIERDEIILILGARQVGKTSLLKYIQGILDKDGEATFFIDLEDIELRRALKTPRDILSYIKTLGYSKGKAYLFLDEVHYLENATSILKFLHDHHPEIKLFITGSSSLKLRFKLGDPLTGRKSLFILRPLSFREYLLFTRNEKLHRILTPSKKEELPEPFLSQVLDAYGEYLIWGGYPKVALTDDYTLRTNVLKEIFLSYLEREVRGLVREDSIERFSDVVQFLAVQNGNLLKVLEVSKEVGLQRITVQRYITILEETFMGMRLRPLATNKQKEITRTPKFYLLDTGFVNFLTKDFRPLKMRQNYGALVETTILNTLLQKLSPIEELRFWRTRNGSEVDFVVRSSKGYIPYEVKWREKPRVSASLKNFIKDYNPQEGCILTKKTWQTAEYNTCTLKFFPAFML